jgi:hypothetical protein
MRYANPAVFKNGYGLSGRGFGPKRRVGLAGKTGLDDRFRETGLDEVRDHGTGIMLVDSSFEKS